jgi:hypothetical protein
MVQFDVYSRRGCHLCENLIEDLLAMTGSRAQVLVHDVDTRRDWLERYGQRVPVVESAGTELCEARLDRTAVMAALAAQE